HPPCHDSRRHRARAPRRGLQSVEYAEPRCSQRRAGECRLRNDHIGARPASGAARAEAAVLTHMDWSAIALSLRLAAATTIVLLAIGLPLASWLALSGRRGRWAVDALVALPLVLPPTVLGYYVLVMLGPRSPIGRAFETLTGSPIVFSFS